MAKKPENTLINIHPLKYGTLYHTHKSCLEKSHAKDVCGKGKGTRVAVQNPRQLGILKASNNTVAIVYFNTSF